MAQGSLVLTSRKSSWTSGGAGTRVKKNQSGMTSWRLNKELEGAKEGDESQKYLSSKLSFPTIGTLLNAKQIEHFDSLAQSFFV